MWLRSGSLLLLAVVPQSCVAAGAEEWKRRRIYQALTDRFARSDGQGGECDLGHQPRYCGGTFRGLEQNLDHIQNDLGLDAVWISPVITNSEHGYHGYWGTDMYGINAKFGSPEDLQSLSMALHRRGMWLMLDVVANHVGLVIRPGHNEDAEINVAAPFNNSEFYHDYCPIRDWSNQHEVENCWLANLPDLKQEHETVRTELLKWIQRMVETFSVDGLRIDTCQEVPKWFWKQFKSSAKVFTLCEVDSPNVGLNAGYQVAGAADATLNYPLFWLIRNVFVSRMPMQLTIRKVYNDMQRQFSDMHSLGNFVDNHDNPRFLSLGTSLNQFKSALAFSFLFPGIPILYQGDEFAFSGGSDPWNREAVWPALQSPPSGDSDLRSFVKTLSTSHSRYVAARGGEGPPEFVERYAQWNFYCFSRGQLMGCFSNFEIPVHYTVMYHPYQPGQRVCNVFRGEADCLVVDRLGTLAVVLNNGEPKWFVPASSEATFFT